MFEPKNPHGISDAPRNTRKERKTELTINRIVIIATMLKNGDIEGAKRQAREWGMSEEYIKSLDRR